MHVNGRCPQGRYIPVFAATIYDRNAQLVEAGLTPINLTSIMIGQASPRVCIHIHSLTGAIGNGCTDFATMFPSYYDAQCQDPTFPPVQGIA